MAGEQSVFWLLPIMCHDVPGMFALVCLGTLVVTLALHFLPFPSGLQVLGDALALGCGVGA